MPLEIYSKRTTVSYPLNSTFFSIHWERIVNLSKERERVRPRTSKKLSLPVVLVVSNLNIQTFQHSNIQTFSQLELPGVVRAGRS